MVSLNAGCFVEYFDLVLFFCYFGDQKVYGFVNETFVDYVESALVTVETLML